MRSAQCPLMAACKAQSRLLAKFGHDGKVVRVLQMRFDGAPDPVHWENALHRSCNGRS
jgi:hypothetical protein